MQYAPERNDASDIEEVAWIERSEFGYDLRFLRRLDGFSAPEMLSYGPGKHMPPRPQGPTAAFIQQMVIQHHVTYTATNGDALAGHFARLADNDTVEFDEVEQMLLALQRAGHLDRNEMVRLQANYLREAKR